MVDDEVEPPGVEQVGAAGVILKHLGDGHLLADCAAAAVEEGVVQRVVQIFQKGILGLGAVGLDAQRTAGGGLLGHLGLAVFAHVLNQLVNIVIGAVGVQAVQRGLI